MRTRWLAMLLVGIVTVGGLAACGGDDDDEDATGDDTETTVDDTADDEDEEVDLQAYCDAVAAIETAPEPELDFESMSEEEIQEALADYAAEELVPLAEDIAANTPPEIAGEIDTLVGATEELAETGDFEIFEQPEVQEASAIAHGYDLETCGWVSAPVEATDYAFDGLEESYEAGIVSFEFTNAGDELHEMVLLRKNDDTTESFDELLEMPEEEAEAKVTGVGSIAPQFPGEGDYTVLDLESGDYIALCFIPVGTTPEAQEAMDAGEAPPPEGPPHFVEGMRAEFTVA